MSHNFRKMAKSAKMMICLVYNPILDPYFKRNRRLDRIHQYRNETMGNKNTGPGFLNLIFSVECHQETSSTRTLSRDQKLVFITSDKRMFLGGIWPANYKHLSKTVAEKLQNHRSSFIEHQVFAILF